MRTMIDTYNRKSIKSNDYDGKICEKKKVFPIIIFAFCVLNLIK